MLLPLPDLCLKYKFKPKGVIHIGAHTGEEAEYYQKLGITNVLWVEANPELIPTLKKNVSHLGHLVVNEAVYNEEKACVFNVTNNYQSSSLLDLDYHKTAHPHIHVTHTLKLKTITFTNLIEKYNININKYDFINIDIQGTELYALKSFGNLLNSIKYIYTEVNIKHLYKNNPLIGDLDTYLNRYKFKRIDTKIYDSLGWGDAFYVKNVNNVKKPPLSSINNKKTLTTRQRLILAKLIRRRRRGGRN